MRTTSRQGERFDVTSNVYGHFEKTTRKREAQAMEGTFGI